MILALALLVDPAAAKDLRSRVGVGFHQGFGDTSALSFRVGIPAASPTMNLQIEADVGLDITSTTPGFFAGGRALWGLVAEDNLNLYFGAGAGYLGASKAVRVQPVLAAQFFFFGLENLGFSAEWGVNVDIGAETHILTVGGGPAAAVHYYF